MAIYPSTAPPARRTFTAPARVNLIGEHTDYTGGLVLPIAIPFFTEASIGQAADGNYNFSSTRFHTTRTISQNDRSGKLSDWSDYPVGVLRQLQKMGIQLPSFTLCLSGDIPLGSGLSSSASVEVATAFALLSLANVALSPKEIATLCQRAENEYVLSPCGIMDQFVITAATKGHALLLNTRDLTYELVPMNRGGLSACSIVIANSGVKHSIGGGEYGLRRRELEAGQAVLRSAFSNLRDLGDANLNHLEACKSDMSSESYRRCRHVIGENSRVRAAREAMLLGDPVTLGQIMTDAHCSERDDFECSVTEVDFLVDTAIDLRECYGSRLTGGGFGGCTVNLVRSEEVDSFMNVIREAYRRRFDMEPEMYVCEAVDGVVARAAQTPF